MATKNETKTLSVTTAADGGDIDDVDFLRTFAKAVVMEYCGESYMMVAHSKADKSAFDVDQVLISGRLKKTLTYHGNHRLVLVTPPMEAPFGASSFDGTKFTLPLSLPTSRNKYMSDVIDIEDIASFRRLIGYLEKQVRGSCGEWTEHVNYLPVIRPSADSAKYPDRMRVKILPEDSVFVNTVTGYSMDFREIPKHSTCVCALRVTPSWRMPDGRYGFTLEVLRADVTPKEVAASPVSSGVTKMVVADTP
jgi:hypothetical protein